MIGNKLHSMLSPRPGSSGRWWFFRLGSTALVVLGLMGCGPAGESAVPGGEPSASPASKSRPPAGQGPEAEPWFSDETASSGLDFVHFNGMSGDLLLAEITCGGGALLDFDGDGDLDAYLLQGRLLGEGKTLEEASSPPAYPLPLRDRLYRNDSQPAADGSRRLRFTDVSEELSPPSEAYGCGAAVADYDGDGWSDLYLANLGPNRLLRNRGGRFEDVTEAAGVGDSRSGVTATFFDFDGDGWLDLFVGNNVRFDNSGATVCHSLTGAPDYCGPGAYPAQADLLLRNRGDGSFEDVTASSGLGGARPAPTLGAVAADFDGDGRPDLYVANDGQPNHLWINHGDGTFEDRALLAGSAVNGSGASEASMGVAVADYDGDGDEDIFLSHLIKETNTLYRNDGSGYFEDHTRAARLAAASLPFTSFGAGWLDFDGDGWLDLLVVSGAVTQIPALVQARDPFPLHQTNQLFRSNGVREGVVTFAEATARAGTAFQTSEVSRGAAFGDLDDDGDVDALIINNGGPARLLVNRRGSSKAWLGLRLVAGDPPRDALLARASVETEDGRRLWRRVHTDGSFSSASDPRILFGLGQATEPATVLVIWPDGLEEIFRDLPLRRYSVLHRGRGEPR